MIEHFSLTFIHILICMEILGTFLDIEELKTFATKIVISLSDILKS